MKQLISTLTLILACSFGSTLAATITGIEFTSLTGDRTEVRLTFDSNINEPSSYAIEKPARISIDFPSTISEVDKYHQIGNGNARSATILTAGDRTRLILNLTTLVPYSLKSSGNQLTVLVGESFETDALVAATDDVEFSIDDDSAIDFSDEELGVEPVSISENRSTNSLSINEISNVDFRRNLEGDGQIVISFTNSTADAEINDESGKIRIVVPDFTIPAELRRRLDVIDFSTPVKYIDVFQEGKNGNIIIENLGFYDYLAYQTDRTLTIDVKGISEEEQEQIAREKFPYNGEKLSLNFQDIPVRSVLQLIADFTGLNLVASDSISGSITLRLKNVPWDQALDLVLKTKGLDKRQNGNVLMVAPAEEIAAREKLELEANNQQEKLAPLRTEFIQINYAKATDIREILETFQADVQIDDPDNPEVTSFQTTIDGVLSPRGSIVVDDRTNTLMIRDTASSLERVRRAIAIFDVPIRQVLIEARIVVARSSAGKELGVRWGGTGTTRFSTFDESGYAISGSGSIEQQTTQFNNSFGGEETLLEYPDALVVDLPVNDANASSFAIGITTLDYVLDLELSALETSGNAEVISQPKILTADGKSARILSGTEIPYATGDEIIFRNAVLSLEVLPQITPDNRFVMDLRVTQDSVGDLTEAGPTINKNEVNTQVLVDNGETIVLGGIYQSSEVQSTRKTPFFGDLPVIGALFRSNSSTEEKNELLVFITPKLVEDSLAGR